MSKKSLTILIITIIILLLFGAGFWFLQNKGAQMEEGFGIRDFFPFGRAPETKEFVPFPISSEDEQAPSLDSELPKLRKISKNPTAGAYIFNNENEIIIRFVDIATGHIFEANAEKSGIERISNTTMPKISEAVWAGKNSVVLRYLGEDEETIESAALKLIPPQEIVIFEFTEDLTQGDKGVAVLNLQKTLNLDPETQVAEAGPGSPGSETSFFGPATVLAVKKFQEKYADSILAPQNLTEPGGELDNFTREKLNEITGVKEEPSAEEENLYQTVLTFLPIEIKSLAYIEELQKIFYLQEDGLGTIGTLANPDDSGSEQIFESPAREWSSESGGDNVILTTKPSEDFLGSVFTLNQNGVFKKLLGGVFGLTAKVSDDDENLVFSESKRDGFDLNLYKRDSGSIVKLEQTTLPEKCVWSRQNTEIIYCAVPRLVPKADYPDSWYQGVISFDDDLWMIDTETESGILLENLLFDIDAISLSLSPDENFLLFTNKKDYSLWSYRLVEPEPEPEPEPETFEEETGEETTEN